jgi:hypothetical protein
MVDAHFTSDRALPFTLMLVYPQPAGTKFLCATGGGQVQQHAHLA